MTAFLALIPNPVKYAAVGALACLVAFYAGEWRGRTQANAAAEARNIKATLEQMQERGLIDEAVSDTGITDICIELGGLPDECGQ